MNELTFAIDIVKKLVKAGHTAYFAGGWVRDFLMGHSSKDIDIATDASPDKILDLFPRTILVGLSFGVVIVLIDGKQFEVSSFRKDFNYHDGRRPEYIEFTSPEEDAKRRDFTINGMFYDPLQDIVHDYVQGKEDLAKGIIRAIGNPQERFLEDRLRMIRAIRFAARFGFYIDPETQDAIIENAETLFPAVAMERIWQEFTKMSQSPRFDQALSEMYRLGLLTVIFPELKDVGLHMIRERVGSFDYFPNNCPAILFLMKLFPNAPYENLEGLCRYLKASNRDFKLVKLMMTGRNLVERAAVDPLSVKTHEWVNFYAQADAELCLKVMAAGYERDKHYHFLDQHAKKQLDWDDHIQRLRSGKPLVTAVLLQMHGISPGKPMGILLKEAEKMAMNDDCDNAEKIIQALKKTKLWPVT